MMKVARLLQPQNKRHDAIERIRKEFRKNKSESIEENIDKMLEKAQSSLSYLKIITPKGLLKSNTQAGVTKIVFGDNNESSTGRKAVSNWTGSNMDPDSVSKHYQNLNRAGFRDNSHAKGLF